MKTFAEFVESTNSDLLFEVYNRRQSFSLFFEFFSSYVADCETEFQMAIDFLSPYGEDPQHQLTRITQMREQLALLKSIANYETAIADELNHRGEN